MILSHHKCIVMQIVNKERKKIHVFICKNHHDDVITFSSNIKIPFAGQHCIFSCHKQRTLCLYIVHSFTKVACRSFACRIAFDVHSKLDAKNQVINNDCSPVKLFMFYSILPAFRTGR